MTTDSLEKLSSSIGKLKATTSGIKSTIVPKLNKFRDEFKTSEWQVMEAAIGNYIIDLNSEIGRLEVIKEQLLRQQRS